MDIIFILILVMISQVCTYQIVRFNYVQFIVYQLYIKKALKNK